MKYIWVTLHGIDVSVLCVNDMTKAQAGESRRSQDKHYSDVIMSVMASQITCVSIVCTTVTSAADQTKHQSSALLASVRGIHR